MSDQFQYASPPTAPEKKSNTGLIIGIVVGVLVLCCCCAILAALAFPALFGPDIENIFEEIEREISYTLPTLLAFV